MTCGWCRGPIPVGARRDSKYCSKRCRQAAHRFGQGAVARERADHPIRLAYADPPYPGLAGRYYADHPDYAGEVDHRALLSRLQAYDGWALSTSARPGLQLVLGIAAELGLEVRVAAWFRGGRTRRSRWPAAAWEPVVFSGGRQVLDPSPGSSRDGSRTDALVHHAHARTTDPARVIGAKPAAFAYWMFDLLGAAAGDSLDDLFPGSGGIARAWDLFVSREYSGDASSPAPFDASRRPGGVASAGEHDASPRGVVDASRPGGRDTSRADRADASVSAADDASCRSCTTDRG